VRLTIRNAISSDYPTIADLHNANNEPHFHSTAEKLEARDVKNTHASRLVAVQNDQIIGTAECWYWPEPNAYRVGIHTRDPRASQALQAELERRADKTNRFLATIRADFLEYAHFLETGFKEVFRSFGANLELAQFDPGRFSTLEPALEERGIRIVPRHEWLADDTDSQLEVIQAEANADVPGYEPVVSMQTDYKDRTMHEPFWVALQGERCVGFSSLDGKPDQTTIHFDASGVLRSHRRQGIGLALAARAMTWAKEQGFAEVNDGGTKSNTAHVRILEKLGFELEPDWVTFEKMLEEK
jgi:ribosomal protein S18 acetylase RimI-like enzyme